MEATETKSHTMTTTATFQEAKDGTTWKLARTIGSIEAGTTVKVVGYAQPGTAIAVRAIDGMDIVYVGGANNLLRI